MGQILQELKVKPKKRSRFSKYGRSAPFNRIKGVPCFNYKYLPDSNADQEYPTDGL